METDVLIVGGGPTGLMLANQLGRRGLRPLIIDRHSGPAQQTRAMAVHARTLEIYSQLGVVEEAVACGRRGNGANMWANGQRRARIPLGDIGKGLSPYPYVLMLGQDENERILGEHLRNFGLAVQWNTELVEFHQEADHVKAKVRQPDGRIVEVIAKYVAGCDGGRSTVRELSGIAFPGAPYEQVFFVADTEATGRMVQEELNVYLWRDGFHLFFPMSGRDRWRLVGILPPEFRGKDDLGFDDLAPAIREEAGADLDFRSCSWFSTYKISHRCVEKFRDRRCFLLGDAAHVHSPMGGQGMNTGLQDAYNLAWKLALVIEGKASDAVLDTYDSERKQVAERLLGTTDRAFRLLVSDSWIAGLFRTRIVAKVAATAMKRERAQKTAFLTLSQIGIQYPQSALSKTVGVLPEGAPKAGDRFPWLQLKFGASGIREDLFARLDDTKFNLIAFGQAVPPEFSRLPAEFVRIHEVSDDPENAVETERVNIPARAFYLLRPDGHVGLAGTTLSLADLKHWFVESHMGGFEGSNVVELSKPDAVMRDSGAGTSRQAIR